ncbi:MAG: hypothetical protein AB1896_00615 [Thermodesulfobacteriota bacterium]
MSLLEKAIQIAVQAHQGKKDKAGAPYILHPLRVMFQMDSEEEMTVAVLHDVVEDSDYTLDRLREIGFPDQVLEALDSVTNREAAGETYEDFVTRAGLHPVGLKIKRADLKDNLDLARLAQVTDRDVRRLRKYHQALSRLAELEKVQREVVMARYAASGDGPPAGTAELAPRGVPHPRAVHQWGAAGTLIVTWDGNDIRRPLYPAEFLAVRAAIQSGDPAELYRLSPDFVPFYCPECQVCYRFADWAVRASGRRGKCPEGHERPWLE